MAHGYLRVRNWDRWQYRADRNLPWIKVYRDLLLDPEFMMLTDVQKGHLVCIWMAASARNGCIPDDAKVVQRMISSEITPDLDAFLSLQFLEIQRKRRRPNGAPRREEKNRSDQSRSDPPLPPQEFETAWSRYPKRAGGNSKAKALKAWQARIAAGVDPADMLAGVERYAAFCQATDRIGTEYVKQAATFFGPDEHYAEDWTPPRSTANGNGRYETPHDRLKRLNYVAPEDDPFAEHERGQARVRDA